MGSVLAAPVVDCADVGGDLGVPGGTCYRLTVSCPGIDNEDMALKVNSPVGDPKGTILFTIGGGGSEWYDQRFLFGEKVLIDVLNAGFRTVQFNFQFNPVGFPDGGNSAGWLTGPGGPRKTACRWATIAKWVRTNITAEAGAYCATGNSAGSGAAAYALAHYGQEALFNMLEQTSGPPFVHVEKGCICNSPAVQTVCGQGELSLCYGSDANKFVDPSYNPLGTVCSEAEEHHDTTHKQMFINDSILNSDSQLSYPQTDIHFVFGGLDVGSAEPQAMMWIPMIHAKGAVAVDCVADAPHQIADVEDGANKISSDLIQFCHE